MQFLSPKELDLLVAQAARNGLASPSKRSLLLLNLSDHTLPIANVPYEQLRSDLYHLNRRAAQPRHLPEMAIWLSNAESLLQALSVASEFRRYRIACLEACLLRQTRGAASAADAERSHASGWRRFRPLLLGLVVALSALIAGVFLGRAGDSSEEGSHENAPLGHVLLTGKAIHKAGIGLLSTSDHSDGAANIAALKLLARDILVERSLRAHMKRPNSAGYSTETAKAIEVAYYYVWARLLEIDRRVRGVEARRVAWHKLLAETLAEGYRVGEFLEDLTSYARGVPKIDGFNCDRKQVERLRPLAFAGLRPRFEAIVAAEQSSAVEYLALAQEFVKKGCDRDEIFDFWHPLTMCLFGRDIEAIRSQPFCQRMDAVKPDRTIWSHTCKQRVALGAVRAALTNGGKLVCSDAKTKGLGDTFSPYSAQ